MPHSCPHCSFVSRSSRLSSLFFRSFQLQKDTSDQTDPALLYQALLPPQSHRLFQPYQSPCCIRTVKKRITLQAGSLSYSESIPFSKKFPFLYWICIKYIKITGMKKEKPHKLPFGRHNLLSLLFRQPNTKKAMELLRFHGLFL